METSLFQFTGYTALITPITIGIVQAIKTLGLADRYIPIFSIITGVALSFLGSDPLQATVLQGIAVGLLACGLWSGTKKVAGA